LDENLATVWVWTNYGKSDDLQTNVFSIGTESQSVRVTKLIYLDLLLKTVAELQEVRIKVYFIFNS